MHNNKTILSILGAAIFLAAIIYLLPGMSKRKSAGNPVATNTHGTRDRLTFTTTRWNSSAAQSDETRESSAAQLRLRFQEALATNDPKTIDEAIVSILSAWVNADPAGAAQYASSVERGPQRDMILGRAVGFWAMSNPGEASQWVSKNMDTGEARKFEYTICIQQAQSDAQAALATAEKFGLQSSEPSIQNDLFGKLVAQNATAALQWALSQPSGPARDNFVTQAAIGQSAGNPFAAAKTILDMIPPGDRQDAAMSAILGQYTGTSVASDSPAQDATAIGILRQWAVHNPAAASAWTQQLPPDNPLLASARAAVQTR